MKKTLITFCLLLLCFLAKAEEPWSVSPYSPVIAEHSTKAPSHRHKKTVSGMSLYQQYISSFDGPRCQMQPTCSAYAAGAFHQHGYFLGLVLTADRLMHEGAKVDFLKILQPLPYLQDWHIGPKQDDWLWAMLHYHFRPRFKDSLNDNTFWWQ